MYEHSNFNLISNNFQLINIFILHFEVFFYLLIYIVYSPGIISLKNKTSIQNKMRALK